MEELDLKELLNLFWNKKVAIIIIVILFMAIGVVYTMAFTTPMYSASTELLIANSGRSEINANTTVTAADITVNSKLVSTYSELIKKKNILRQVITNLNMNLDEDILKKHISVNSVKDTEIIEIVVKDENPVYAAQISNEIAKVFMEKVKDFYPIDNVQIVDEAEVPDGPSNINHKKDIIIFACIGLVVSAAYILIANMLDTTVKTAEDIEKGYKVPVLASIPIYETDIQKIKGGKR